MEIGKTRHQISHQKDNYVLQAFIHYMIYYCRIRPISSTTNIWNEDDQKCNRHRLFIFSFISDWNIPSYMTIGVQSFSDLIEVKYPSNQNTCNLNDSLCSMEKIKTTITQHRSIIFYGINGDQCMIVTDIQLFKQCWKKHSKEGALTSPHENSDHGTKFLTTNTQ